MAIDIDPETTIDIERAERVEDETIDETIAETIDETMTEEEEEEEAIIAEEKRPWVDAEIPEMITEDLEISLIEVVLVI